MIIKGKHVRDLINSVESGKITTMVATRDGDRPTSYLCVVHVNDVIKVEEAFAEVDLRVEASLVSKNYFKDSDQ